MGFLNNLFRRAEPKIEQRAMAMGYTADLVAARAEWLSGRSNVAELTATVQSCVSLWEGAFTLADVQGTDMLDRRALAMMARSLALRGEAMLLIRDRLLPVTDWDIKTRQGEPVAYRVNVSEIGGGLSETVLAPEVLHVRIGSSPVTPWAGTSPLHRASLSADLLQQIETALRDVYRDAPIGSQIVPLPDSSSEDMAGLRRSFRGARGQSLVVEGVAQATAAGMNPQLEKRVEGLTPDLQRAMPAETLEAARDAILGVYGVLPGLLNRSTTGPLVREGRGRWPGSCRRWRRRRKPSFPTPPLRRRSARSTGRRRGRRNRTGMRPAEVAPRSIWDQTVSARFEGATTPSWRGPFSPGGRGAGRHATSGARTCPAGRPGLRV